MSSIVFVSIWTSDMLWASNVRIDLSTNQRRLDAG
jgi:hypothetical protein